MQAIRITLPGKAPLDVSIGTRISELLPSRASNGLPVLAAICNNMVMPLFFPVFTDATLEPLTLADPYGWAVYRSSLSFLLAKTAHKLFPGQECRVRNSIGSGLYCTIEWKDKTPVAISSAIDSLKKEMATAVKEDLPIVQETLSYQAAIQLFESTGQSDKLNLLAHRNPPVVLLHRCGEFRELCQQPLVPRLGLLNLFDLIPMGEGFVLQIPTSAKPVELPAQTPSEQLFRVYQEHIKWGRIIGITTVGGLNQAIIEKRAEEYIQTVEALHEKKLGRIADEILERKTVRLVLVAGPSSAGKTTFSKRLISQLRVNGFKPLLLSTDNYFVGDARNPRDEQGNLDYEHIEAMDLPRLNSDLMRLLNGEEVRMRGFNFKIHEGFDQEETTQLPEDGIIVMEGIHSLNPRLTADIPKEKKYLIYINALTQLGVDSGNRISTTDTRIIRRMVRDHQFRNRPAIETLRMWESVSKGERRWIYPFQQEADAVFNSALDYELAVLKPLVSPLLNQIKPWDREYIEARRLSGILHNFSIMSSEAVPGNSILREYIGGSQFRY